MRFPLPKLNIAPKHLLRQCGYQEIENPHTKETSYARSLEPGRFYPRFHIYLDAENEKEIYLNLHLDMKKPSYEGAAAHGGEYAGATVEKEAERIKNAAQKFLHQIPSRPLGFQKEKSILEKILDYLK